MEQHPVPQNVTTFQFRLVGDMTIKQFGYLAGGAILGYIFYKLPIPFFFSWPLAIVTVIAGIAFAFFPVEDRPLDVWVLSFFKSVYNPTQYIWVKQAPPPPAPPPVQQPAAPVKQTTPPSKHADVLQNIFTTPTVLTATTHTTDPMAWLKRMFMPAKKAPVPVTPTMRMDFTPPPEVQARQRSIEKKDDEIEQQVKTLETQLQSTNLQADERVLALQKQLTDLLAQHKMLEDELAALKKGSEPAPTPPPAPVRQVPQPVMREQVVTGAPHVPTVQIITADRAVKAGLPKLTTFPNIVTGIVKDSGQNLLPGVLVTVKDKEGVPLRALKTNRLGQFAASTPLPNGVYFLEIEDPRVRYSFDRAQITLNGSVVPALEIFAKSQKEITRAKLEKALFGQTQ